MLVFWLHMGASVMFHNLRWHKPCFTKSWFCSSCKFQDENGQWCCNRAVPFEACFDSPSFDRPIGLVVGRAWLAKLQSIAWDEIMCFFCRSGPL
jgi:hypothetical protein